LAEPQVYVGLPSLPNIPQPPRQLKGFQRVELSAGLSAAVTVQLDARSFSYWDETSHGWMVHRAPTRFQPERPPGISL